MRYIGKPLNSWEEKAVINREPESSCCLQVAACKPAACLPAAGSSSRDSLPPGDIITWRCDPGPLPCCRRLRGLSEGSARFLFLYLYSFSSFYLVSRTRTLLAIAIHITSLCAQLLHYKLHYIITLQRHKIVCLA